MCLIVIPSNTLTKLVAAAQAVQSLVDDETLSKAYVHSDEDAQAQSVAALDKLAECTAGALAEHKDVSPFIRYRKEAMDETNLSAMSLRHMVRNLFGGGKTGVDLFEYFMNANPLYRRIALEMITSASQRRGDEIDPALVDMFSKIRDRFEHELGGEA